MFVALFSLETESEARRTLIELALQDASPHPAAADASVGESAGEASAASPSASGLDREASEGGEGTQGSSNRQGQRAKQLRGETGGSGVGRVGAESSTTGIPSGLRRGVSPEKGASLWAGVGIGAMLQVRHGRRSLFIHGISPLRMASVYMLQQLRGCNRCLPVMSVTNGEGAAWEVVHV